MEHTYQTFSTSERERRLAREVGGGGENSAELHKKAQEFKEKAEEAESKEFVETQEAVGERAQEAVKSSQEAIDAFLKYANGEANMKQLGDALANAGTDIGETGLATLQAVTAMPGDLEGLQKHTDNARRAIDRHPANSRGFQQACDTYLFLARAELAALPDSASTAARRGELEASVKTYTKLAEDARAAVAKTSKTNFEGPPIEKREAEEEAKGGTAEAKENKESVQKQLDAMRQNVKQLTQQVRELLDQIDRGDDEGLGLPEDKGYRDRLRKDLSSLPNTLEDIIQGGTKSGESLADIGNRVRTEVQRFGQRYPQLAISGDPTAIRPRPGGERPGRLSEMNSPGQFRNEVEALHKDYANLRKRLIQARNKTQDPRMRQVINGQIAMSESAQDQLQFLHGRLTDFVDSNRPLSNQAKTQLVSQLALLRTNVGVDSPDFRDMVQQSRNRAGYGPGRMPGRSGERVSRGLDGVAMLLVALIAMLAVFAKLSKKSEAQQQQAKKLTRPGSSVEKGDKEARRKLEKRQGEIKSEQKDIVDRISNVDKQIRGIDAQLTKLDEAEMEDGSLTPKEQEQRKELRKQKRELREQKRKLQARQKALKKELGEIQTKLKGTSNAPDKKAEDDKAKADKAKEDAKAKEFVKKETEAKEAQQKKEAVKRLHESVRGILNGMCERVPGPEGKWKLETAAATYILSVNVSDTAVTVRWSVDGEGGSHAVDELPSVADAGDPSLMKGEVPVNFSWLESTGAAMTGADSGINQIRDVLRRLRTATALNQPGLTKEGSEALQNQAKSRERIQNDVSNSLMNAGFSYNEATGEFATPNEYFMVKYNEGANRFEYRHAQGETAWRGPDGGPQPDVIDNVWDVIQAANPLAQLSRMQFNADVQTIQERLRFIRSMNRALQSEPEAKSKSEYV